jgi:hypothetical protein
MRAPVTCTNGIITFTNKTSERRTRIATPRSAS